jgi:cytoskeletal protein CcmA (bactofilin family)
MANNEFVVKNGLIVSGSTNVSGSVTAFSFTGSFSGSFSGSTIAPGSTTQILFNSGGLAGTNPRFVFSGSRLGVNTSAPFATAHITQYDPTLPALPAGYQFLIDQLGQYLVDSASNYLVGADPVNYASASFIVDSLPFTNVIFVSGNRVGINTGLATEALDVIGNVKAYNFLGTASSAVSSLYALSASYAVSSSYAQQATSASYALSSSYAQQATSASYVSGSIVAPGQTTYLTYNSGGILEGNPDLVYSGSKFGIGTNNPQALTHIYQTESPFTAPIVPGIELIDFNGDYLATEGGAGLVGDDGLYPNSALKVDSLTNNNVLYVSGSRIGVNKGTPNANLDVNGNVLVSGSLTVSGSSTFRNIGPAEFTGSLNVSGSEVIISSPVISLSSPVVYVTGSLELSNQLILTSPFNVGALNFGNAGLIQGGSGINNDIRIGYGFGGFTYLATFSGTNGNLTLPQGLTASGSTNISGSTTIRGNTTVTGSLNVSGSTNIRGNTNITGSLNVSGSINNNGVNLQSLMIAYSIALG